MEEITVEMVALTHPVMELETTTITTAVAEIAADAAEEAATVRTFRPIPKSTSIPFPKKTITFSTR